MENDIFKQDWRSRKKSQIFQYVGLKWTLALLIGIATGLVGFFNNLAVENIAGFKLLITSDLMLKHRYVHHFFTITFVFNPGIVTWFVWIFFLNSYVV